jgi:hypothetical protein
MKCLSLFFQPSSLISYRYSWRLFLLSIARDKWHPLQPAQLNTSVFYERRNVLPCVYVNNKICANIMQLYSLPADFSFNGWFSVLKFCLPCVTLMCTVIVPLTSMVLHHFATLQSLWLPSQFLAHSCVRLQKCLYYNPWSSEVRKL